ncbi:MAG: Glutamate/gamma-aminobutyrate antiporter [Chlamydiae bacterium]|nr:Glutamate/gamma-aminobutyrate antiporter [Chlamydiota bacterium]
MQESPKKVQRTLTIFMLTMINVATIGSVKNWPVTAEYGFSSVFFIILATLIFFIPTSLVAAELATAWPKVGGVFAWVKEAFGHRSGFLAAWLLWFQNIVWYPTALSFIAATIAYILNPILATNPLYTFLTILLIFWATTLVNFRGMRTSGTISSVGMVFGTFLPGLFIIVLGVIWYFSGLPSQISFTWASFTPDMGSPKQLVLFTGVLISLAGMEMSAVHAKDVMNPKRNYPRAILFSALIILGLSIPGVLAIAIVVPQQDISLLAGSLQAIAVFLEAYQLNPFMPYIALLIAVGAIASVSTWVVGPSKGLLAAAQSGDLPPLFRKVNNKGMPVPLLLFQAIVVSFISLLFIFLPTLNEAYWMLMAIVSELYLIMYLLMFAAAIKLRYKHPNIERPYKIPGGNVGMWCVAGLGLVSSLFTMFIGFFPPDHILIKNSFVYVLLLLGGVVLFSLGPTLILLFQKPHWKTPLTHEEDSDS